MRLSFTMLFWIGGAVIFAALGLIGMWMLLVGHTMPGANPAHPIAAARSESFSGGVIRYEDRGSGDTALLLLHAYNADMAQWDSVWNALSRQPTRQLRIDIPGYGASEWPNAKEFGLGRESERIIALLDRLGIKKIRIAGTSMGASLAAWIASAYPERVESVCLMAPSGYPGSLTYSGLFGRLVRPGPLNVAATWVARTRLYATVFPRNQALQTLTVTASYGEPWKRALARIQAPVLILWSRGDGTADYQAAVGVHAAIRNSILVTLDSSARHSIPSTRPHLAAAVVRKLALGVPPADIPSSIADSLWLPGEWPIP